MAPNLAAKRTLLVRSDFQSSVLASCLCAMVARVIDYDAIMRQYVALYYRPDRHEYTVLLVDFERKIMVAASDITSMPTACRPDARKTLFCMTLTVQDSLVSSDPMDR
jgi:hypothetical protein